MSPVGLAPAVTPLASHVAPMSALVQEAPTSRYGWETYVVRPGDAVSDLAIRRQTTPWAIIARNHLQGGGHWLRVGQRLSVPRTTRLVTTTRPRTPAPARYVTYTVRSGDTLGAIAVRFRVREAVLVSSNGLRRSAYIYPGQRLRVPAKAARAVARAARPAVSSYRVVRVRSGETVSGIAARYGVPLASVLKANRLGTRTLIAVGYPLKVPAAASRPTSGSSTFAGRTYAGSIVGAAAANRRYLARAAVPSRSQTKAMIIATARRHGVDPRLALAISWQESGWSQRQVSVANAIGVMQVIPSSGVWASQLAGRRLSLLKAQDNITAGVVIIRSLTRSAGTQTQAIAGYYQGLSSVRRSGMYADTKQYVRAVLALRARM